MSQSPTIGSPADEELDLRGVICPYNFVKTKLKLDGVQPGALPVTLTVYCRGDAYKDPDGLTRYRPCTVVDPKTGNVYNDGHLKNGDTFEFPGGGSVQVKKETFLIVTSALTAYVFKAD